MTITRRRFLTVSAIAGASAPLWASATPSFGKAEVGDNGLHIQDWFLDSFLELSDDFSEAANSGKGLIVLFEQRGCPYCRELHEVNLAKTQVRTYMQKHFETVQLDIFGSREVTDFDGKSLEERKLASRWAVNFTPTAVFFAGDPSAASGKTGREAEVARMPGYFKPFHFLSMLEFVAEGHYKSQGFQRYLQDKFKVLKEKGVDPDVW